MLDAIVPAALEDVQRAGDVAAYIGMRLLQRVSYARLGREVHDARELFAGEKLRHRRIIGQLELDEAEARSGETCESRLLEIHVVVVVEIVEPDDLVTGVEQALRSTRTDEARGACDQDLHSRPSTAAAGNTCLMSYSTCLRRHRRRTPRAPSSRNCRCATATTAAS